MWLFESLFYRKLPQKNPHLDKQKAHIYFRKGQGLWDKNPPSARKIDVWKKIQNTKDFAGKISVSLSPNYNSQIPDNE